MPDELGKLQVKIEADTKALEQGLAGAEKQVSGFAGAIQKHHKAIGMAMTAAGGAILAAGALSIKTYMEMGDEVQKMALRTGFSTEALSELRHAAEISGADLSTLEKGVKRMSSTILDASDGMETYIRAFRHIGIEVEDLMELNPEEQFLKIAMAIAELEDETVRAAIAQDMFGRAGTELLPLFAQGADGIEKLREEAHKLGIVFDQEAANKAAKMTDAMKRVDEATSGLKMKIAEALIPTLLPLVDKIQAIITRMGDWMKAHPELTKAITIASIALGGLLVVLGPMMIMLPGIILAAKGLAVAFVALTGPVGLAILAIAGLIAIGILVWKNWDSIIAFFKGIPEVMKSVFSTLADIMLAPFRFAIQGIEKMINWLIEQINKIKINIPSWVPSIGGKGFGFNIPTISLPKFKYGGIVPGPIGQPMPIMAHGGERFFGADMAGNVTVNIYPQGSVLTERDLLSFIREGLLTLKRQNVTTGI